MKVVVVLKVKKFEKTIDNVRQIMMKVEKIFHIWGNFKWDLRYILKSSKSANESNLEKYDQIWSNILKFDRKVFPDAASLVSRECRLVNFLTWPRQIPFPPASLLFAGIDVLLSVRPLNTIHPLKVRLCMPGRPWGFVKLWCSLGSLRASGEFPQAPGHLYKDETHSDNDGNYCEANGRATLRACAGDQANQTEAIQ